MSLAKQSISEAPIGAQVPIEPAKKPPRGRQTVAKADVVADPEAR
jgi:hypothetical protein